MKYMVIAAWWHERPQEAPYLSVLVELLIHRVNQAMLDGWHPIGGICTDGTPEESNYLQAMVRGGKP